MGLCENTQGPHISQMAGVEFMMPPFATPRREKCTMITVWLGLIPATSTSMKFLGLPIPYIPTTRQDPWISTRTYE